MGVGATVAVAVWTMLPAYVPNNAAVLAGGGRPIDGGRTWRGSRLLGDGKTWRGTAAGTAAGLLLALALNPVAPAVESTLGVALPRFSPVVGLALSFGAMLGDVLASFLKRRTGRERGAAFPGLDQLDFAVVALSLSALADFGWFRTWLLDPPTVLVVVLALTPALHLLTNGIAYLLDLKDEPW